MAMGSLLQPGNVLRQPVVGGDHRRNHGEAVLGDRVEDGRRGTLSLSSMVDDMHVTIDRFTVSPEISGTCPGYCVNAIRILEDML